MHGKTRRLRRKRESKYPLGSLKGRMAVSLIDHVADRIDKEVGIIESTSGNLGVAMSAEYAAHGIPFTAVVDSKRS